MFHINFNTEHSQTILHGALSVLHERPDATTSLEQQLSLPPGRFEVEVVVMWW